MPSIEHPDSREVQTINLIPGIPVPLVLGDDPVNFVTRHDKYIASAVLQSKKNVVTFFNRENGQRFEITVPGLYSLGAQNFPPGFLSENQKYVSFTHFQFSLLEFNKDGRARIQLQDLCSTNGTKVVFLNEEETTSKKEVISSSAPRIIGGGLEGHISSASGDCNAITHRGHRESNEDGVLIGDGMIAVADGMGGYAAGEKASLLALHTLQKQSKIPVSQELFQAICQGLKASGEIHGDSGCTIAIAKKSPSPKPGHTRLELGNVGDSKIYLISTTEKRLLWESKDQSWIQQLLDNKTLDDPIFRYTHLQNSIISNSINIDGLVLPAEIIHKDVPTGSVIVILCSDGVSDFVTPEEVLEIALRKRQLCTEEIINLAISRQKKEGVEIKLVGQVRMVDLLSADNASAAVMTA